MDLLVRQSSLGKAVFANRGFKKGIEIIEFTGRLMRHKELPEIVTPEDDRYIQIGKDTYLGPSGNFDDFINHSCNPNSGIQISDERVSLVAIQDIRKGEELTWDYSTTMDEDKWEMDCLCQHKNCRKRIRDFKYLPEETQQRYILLAVVPKYILEHVKKPIVKTKRNKEKA